MQQDDRPHDAIDDEAADEPTALVGYSDVERPRRMSPALTKAVAYKRDRRFVAEYPHSSRKAWPRIKALRNQIYRRRVDRALHPVFGEVTPDIEEIAAPAPTRPQSRYGPRSRYGPLHGNIPLGEWVDNKLEKRFSFVGSNIGAKINIPRYRRRLVPFLESVVSGQHGHSVELARRFAVLLDDLPVVRRGYPAGRLQTDGVSWIPGWYRALIELFVEQPEWEARLRAWIAETAGETPTVAEPAWKRIRRHKRRPVR